MELFTDESRWKKYKIETHSKAWYDFRTVGFEYQGEFFNGGFGASETSKLFPGLNKYPPVLQAIFYHKIGMEVPDKFANEATFWGQNDESGIVKAWEFWDGKPGNYVQNYLKWVEAGKPDSLKQRRAVQCDYYLVNKKYPWLFCSLDSAIPAGEMNMITRQPLPVAAPLEVKTIGYYAGKNWIDKVPEYHIIQLNHQMIVTESRYGEIVLKREGQTLDVKYYERNDDICDKIVRLSEDFWKNRVLPGRVFHERVKFMKAKGNNAGVEDMLSRIMQLEPEVDDSESYRDYQDAKHQVERTMMQGKLSDLKTLKKIKTIDGMMKLLKSLKTYEENKVRDKMIKNMVEEIIIDQHGHFRYKDYRSGKRLYAELRQGINEDSLQEELTKLNLIL